MDGLDQDHCSRSRTHTSLLLILEEGGGQSLFGNNFFFTKT